MPNNKKKMEEYKVSAAAVHEGLLRDGDPIEVRDCPAAEAEYDSYVPVVVRLLLEQANIDRIAEHLTQLETVTIGLSRSDREDRNRRVAKRLLQLVA